MGRRSAARLLWARLPKRRERPPSRNRSCPSRSRPLSSPSRSHPNLKLRASRRLRSSPHRWRHHRPPRLRPRRFPPLRLRSWRLWPPSRRSRRFRPPRPRPRPRPPSVDRTARAEKAKPNRRRASRSAASSGLPSGGRLLSRGLLARGNFGREAASEHERGGYPRLRRRRFCAPGARNGHIALHRVTGPRLEIATTLLANGRALLIGQPDEEVLAEQPREHVAVHKCRQVAEHWSQRHRGLVGDKLGERRFGLLARFGHHARAHSAHVQLSGVFIDAVSPRVKPWSG